MPSIPQPAFTAAIPMTGHPQKLALVAAGIALAGAAVTVALATAERDAPAAGPAATRLPPASLTVAVARLRPATLPVRLRANGNIMAWQEASIGTEADGLRLAEVRVNVGDTVRRGQPLATLAAGPVEAELARSRAAVAEAEAVLAEAAGNAGRARALQASGALSAQQIGQYLGAERTALARLAAARAAEQAQRLRLAQTRITAPDDGVISARVATVGAVVPAGQELFRLIRGGRLEWRAEVPAADLALLRPGQKVTLKPSGGKVIEGRLRKLGPVVDASTRNGLAYVDLLTGDDTVRAGMFARGEFEIGSDEVMTLPQGAVQLREGFSYVMRIGPDARVIRTRVTPGRRWSDRIEIVSGLDASDRIVASGAAFLGDGDLVRVIQGAQ
ncbi:efflux RND transporter periplasmic adaptor subunit [Methylibium rhizosphaerae]|uniref:efflux RND transporter periplasmic adaptor subunit n=1 Tax=Methylibium rhizosphaerae TaxID=2570323 RepID=UPI001FEAA968|nr:efflux RND transporter periplasmic adaptor subunit [Methylibium rhizosphaerae]